MFPNLNDYAIQWFSQKTFGGLQAPRCFFKRYLSKNKNKNLMFLWSSCQFLHLLMGYRGTAPNTKCFLVAVTHPKNNYSSRTPCSSLLPLLNAHATTSGKQSNFTRKSSNHNKPSEGKAANPKLASNLPSTADSSHQAVPANKQVNCSREATLPCFQESRRP